MRGSSKLSEMDFVQIGSATDTQVWIMKPLESIETPVYTPAVNH